MDRLNTRQKRLSSFLKIIVIVSALLGTFLSAYAGRHSFMGGSRVFMYFTIQSNIARAIICGIGLYLIKKGSNVSRTWYIIKFVGTVSITLTGVVFGFVLAPTLGAYAIYAGVGFVKGWEFADGINYPYFFLNWGSPAGAFGFTKEMPYMGSAWWIIVLLLFLIVVGYCYLALAELIFNKCKNK